MMEWQGPAGLTSIFLAAACRACLSVGSTRGCTHQLSGQLEQVAAPVATEQNWPDGQKPVVHAGVVHAGAPVQPGRQVLQVVASVQVAQLAPQLAQAGAPLSTVQYWFVEQEVPQSGWLQSAPFQPGAHLEQLVADVQDRLRG